MNTTSFFRTVGVLTRREVQRFFRQKSRVFSALATPALFWVVLGTGIHSSDYLTYFFPGAFLLVVLFTAVFSTISFIEDRQTGFLQSLGVAPVPRLVVLLGKTTGCTALGILHGCLFSTLLIFTRLEGSSVQAVLAAAGGLLALTWALSAFGTWLAFRMHSIQGFHAVMNLILMPLWLLSGAVFPMETASAWLRNFMSLNPLTYGLVLMRRALFPTTLPPQAPGILFSLGVVFSFAFLVTWGMARSASEKNVWRAERGSRMKRKIIAAAVVSLLAAAGVFARHRFSPSPPPKLGKAPVFALTTSEGKTFSSDVLQGKAWVADFIFTRCAGTCPAMTQTMRNLRNHFRNEDNMAWLSITVDPDRDTPEVLTSYASSVSGEEKPKGWFFLTGEKDKIYRLAKEGFRLAAGENPDPSAGEEFIHSTRFVLVDGQGFIRGYYDGMDAGALSRLKKDLRVVLRGRE